MHHAMQKTLFFLLAATIWSIWSACLAQEPDNQSSQKGMIVFHPVTSKVVKLANGIVADDKDWPTLFAAKFPDRAGICSGTLVGPNTFLLAAHCVDTPSGKPLGAQLLIGDRPIAMVCEMHPDYVKGDYQLQGTRSSEDFALCLLDDDGKHPTAFANMSFEVIDAETPLKLGDPVLMTGFGCLTLKVSDGVLYPSRFDEALRIGDEKIASSINKWHSYPAYITTRSPEDSNPALCPGDSGGPLMSGVTTRAPKGKRRVRGVNSKICTVRRDDNYSMCASSGGTGTWDIVSVIAATGYPSFGQWAKDWIARNADKKPIVCGLNSPAGVAPCRK